MLAFDTPVAQLLGAIDTSWYMALFTTQTLWHKTRRRTSFTWAGPVFDSSTSPPNRDLIRWKVVSALLLLW